MKSPPIPKEAKRVFKGVIYEVYQWEQKVFDGTTQTHERLKRTDTAKVIPVLANGNILVLKEEQPGFGTFVDFPGGRVDEGEDPLHAAKRELTEETGYEAKEITEWLRYSPNSNIIWDMHVYIAKGLSKVKQPVLDPGEKITTFEMSFDELLEIPDNKDYFGFRGGGLLVEELIRAKYDLKKRDGLKKLLGIKTNNQ